MMCARVSISRRLALRLAVLSLFTMAVTHGQGRRPVEPGGGAAVSPPAADSQAPAPAAGSDPPRERRLANPAHVANIVRAAMDGLDRVPREVIVKFSDELPGFAAEQLAARLLERERPTRFTPLGDAVLIDLENAADLESVLSVLRAQPEVDYAEPNYIRRQAATPNDPQYSAQWNLPAVHMEGAWDIAQGGSASLVVAVVDSGLAYLTSAYQFRYWNGRGFSNVVVPFAAADDLITSGRVVDPYDYYWGDAEPVDLSRHGTHVAGTIGQLTNNGQGAAGIAYNVALMPLKVCYSYWDLQFFMGELGVPGYASTSRGGCPTSDTVLAIRRAADRGAKVINLSLGGSTPSAAEREALLYAVQKGAFVAIAAGNEFDDGNPPSYPGADAKDIDGVVAVAAVDRNLKHAHYSNTGPYVELAAPGGDTRSGSSGGILQQTMDNTYFAYAPSLFSVPRFDVMTYAALQGTSMATPHVSGLAALAASRGLSRPEAIEAAMKRFARDLGSTGRDDEFGYGLIDARATLRGLGVMR